MLLPMNSTTLNSTVTKVHATRQKSTAWTIPTISGITWEALPIVETILLQRLSEITAIHANAKLLSEQTAEALVLGDMIARHGLSVGSISDYLSVGVISFQIDALLTGHRRESLSEQINRAELPFEEDDKQRGIKIYHPLADWNQELLWAYIQTHKIPYHHLEELEK